MKTFTIVWHYIADHGVVQTRAETAEQALTTLMQVYSGDDFKAKANCFVFEGEPKYTMISAVYPEKIGLW